MWLITLIFNPLYQGLNIGQEAESGSDAEGVAPRARRRSSRRAC